MKNNPFALIIGGREGVNPEQMHEYVKKVLEAEEIPFFEFNYTNNIVVRAQFFY